MQIHMRTSNACAYESCICIWSYIWKRCPAVITGHAHVLVCASITLTLSLSTIVFREQTDQTQEIIRKIDTPPSCNTTKLELYTCAYACYVMQTNSQSTNCRHCSCSATNLQSWRIRTCVFAYVYVYMYTYVCTYIYIYIYIYIHTLTQINSHVCTHTCKTMLRDSGARRRGYGEIRLYIMAMVSLRIKPLHCIRKLSTLKERRTNTPTFIRRRGSLIRRDTVGSAIAIL